MSRSIVLDLPLPPAVNISRRIDWHARHQYSQWLSRADATVLATIPGHRLPAPIGGPYEAIITVRQGRHDLDAHLKSLLDYVVRCELVGGDNPRHLRRIVLAFGDAPEGARIELISINQEGAEK